MEMATDRREFRKRRREQLGLPRYTLGEEIFNSVTHAVGVVFSVVALVLLLQKCARTPINIASVSIFGGTMIALYFISSLYHGFGICPAKKVFRIMDHCTIFLLIAGTYTPLVLLKFPQPTGVYLCVAVWAVAAVGILLNIIDMKRFNALSMACYLGLGWLVLFFIGDLVASVDQETIWLLVAGGITYTIGAIVYGIGSKVPYMHSFWHFFVMGGSIFHFFVVYRIA